MSPFSRHNAGGGGAGARAIMEGTGRQGGGRVAMWRTPTERGRSAGGRLKRAVDLWGWRPHARQREFFASRAQVRVAACGRRWGKTEALSVDIATLAVDEAAAGRACRQLVVAPTDAQARLIGGAALARLEAAQGSAHWPPGLVVSARRRPALCVTLAGGAAKEEVTITCRTAGRDGRSLRGLWAHRIVVDEAGYVPDEVLDEVLLPMLADRGGELTLASSPCGRRGVFYRLFAQGAAAEVARPAADNGGVGAAPRGCPLPPAANTPAANTPAPNEGQSPVIAPTSPLSAAGRSLEAGAVTYASFQCPSTDNRHLDRGWLAALAEDLGESRYAQEVLAQFVDDYGAVFREDDIEGCVAADDAVTLDNGNLVSLPVGGHWYSVGVDWGRKRDFTVVCVLDASARARGAGAARLVGLWRWQGAGWEAQAGRVGEIVAAFRPLKVLADGNSVGDPVAETLQVEIGRRVTDGGRVPQVERFLFGSESKARLVDHLTLGLSARALAYPPHRALLRELRGFEYGRETSGGRHRMAARGGGHDDCVMALALAWYAAPEGAPPPPSSLLLLGSSLGRGRG